MIKLELGAVSNVGLVREQNEDMILISNTCFCDTLLHTKALLGTAERYIVAVADGLGGHNGGEIASKEVVNSLKEYFFLMPEHLNSDELFELMNDWLHEIHYSLQQKGKANKALEGMGSTLVCFFVYENRFYWMNCGDSRLYRFRGGMLTLLSEDHTLYCLTGNPEHRNVLINSLGGGENSYLDFKDCTDEVLADDVFLLCSDGFTDMLSNPRIESMLSEGKSAEELVQAACGEGGFDNISVCTVRVSLI